MVAKNLVTSASRTHFPEIDAPQCTLLNKHPWVAGRKRSGSLADSASKPFEVRRVKTKWPPGKWCHGRRRSHVRKVFRLCICGGPDPFRSKELIWVAPPPRHFHSSRHVTHFSPALLHFAFPDRHHHHPGSHGTASPCCCISSQEPHVRVCACVCVQEHTRIHACTPTCRLTVHFLRH